MPSLGKDGKNVLASQVVADEWPHPRVSRIRESQAWEVGNGWSTDNHRTTETVRESRHPRRKRCCSCAMCLSSKLQHGVSYPGGSLRVCEKTNGQRPNDCCADSAEIGGPERGKKKKGVIQGSRHRSSGWNCPALQGRNPVAALLENPKMLWCFLH